VIEIPLIDELREVRRRLADACQGDVARYAQMLRERSQVNSKNYVTKPLTPPIFPPVKLPLSSNKQGTVPT
jgi:hypothetical protein